MLVDVLTNLYLSLTPKRSSEKTNPFILQNKAEWDKKMVNEL